jgi:hypothetical protein
MKPDPVLEEEQQGIIIPEVSMSLGFIGTVTHEKPEEGEFIGLVGRKVLVHTGIGSDFEWEGEELRQCPINEVQGVLYEGRWIKLKAFKAKPGEMGEPGIKRCRWCKSTGKGNMIMQHGYCVVCGRDSRGKPQPKPKVIEDPVTGKKKTQYTDKVSDEEKERYGGTDDRKKAKGTAFSFPGQTKKG